MRVHALAIIGLAALLSGCGSPLVDGSSDENLKASIATVRSGLPPARQDAFDKALMVVLMGGVDDLAGMAAAASPANQGKVRSVLNGKSGEEIIALAEDMHATQAAGRSDRTKSRLRTEIVELEHRRSADDAARTVLAKLVISDLHMTQTTRDILGKETTVTMTVKNDTGQAISEVTMVGVVTTPGRSIPWIKGRLYHSIKGGLEPGESQKWEVYTIGDDWKVVDLTPDMVLAIQPTELIGAKKPAFAKLAFDEREQDRLDELQAELAKELANQPQTAAPAMK